MKKKNILIMIIMSLVWIVLLTSFYYLGKKSVDVNWTNKAIERLKESPTNRITIVGEGKHYTLMEVDRGCIDLYLEYSCIDNSQDRGRER